MSQPRRVQRSRAKGFKMPENTVYVGRPTIWGNPYKVGDKDPYFAGAMPDLATVVTQYRRAVLDYRVAGVDLAEIKTFLRGKNLACWCALDQPCHADVLLELANERQSKP